MTSKTLSSSYRVERRWPSVTSWRWVPEHQDLTLAQARAVRKAGREWEPQMRQRIVRSVDVIVG